jgi:hypothetical protein
VKKSSFYKSLIKIPKHSKTHISTVYAKTFKFKIIHHVHMVVVYELSPLEQRRMVFTLLDRMDDLEVLQKELHSKHKIIFASHESMKREFSKEESLFKNELKELEDKIKKNREKLFFIGKELKNKVSLLEFKNLESNIDALGFENNITKEELRRTFQKYADAYLQKLRE